MAAFGLFVLGNSDDNLAQQIATHAAIVHDDPIPCYTDDWCRNIIGQFNIQEAAEQSVMPMEDMSPPQGSIPKGGSRPTHSAHNMQRPLDLSELDAIKEEVFKGGALLGRTPKPVPELGTMCADLPHGLFPKMRFSPEDLKQCTSNPKTTIEMPASVIFELPGEPVDNFGKDMLHKMSKQENEELCTACHETATGRVDLKHHNSAPGLNPNFAFGPDEINCNQRILSSQRIGEVILDDTGEKCGLYAYSRLSPCYMWPLTTRSQMKADSELRFEPIAYVFNSPEQYLESLSTLSDRAELIGLGELSRLVLKYGNLMNKTTPKEVKDYLKGLWELSQDSCTRRGKEWIPFPPNNYKQFQAGSSWWNRPIASRRPFVER